MYYYAILLVILLKMITFSCTYPTTPQAVTPTAFRKTFSSTTARTSTNTSSNGPSLTSSSTHIPRQDHTTSENHNYDIIDASDNYMCIAKFVKKSQAIGYQKTIH